MLAKDLVVQATPEELLEICTYPKIYSSAYSPCEQRNDPAIGTAILEALSLAKHDLKSAFTLLLNTDTHTQAIFGIRLGNPISQFYLDTFLSVSIEKMSLNEQFDHIEFVLGLASDPAIKTDTYDVLPLVGEMLAQMELSVKSRPWHMRSLLCDAVGFDGSSCCPDLENFIACVEILRALVCPST